MARPRLAVDFAIVLHLHDVENLGWSRMAQTYREITGQYISRDTVKRRYLEAKSQAEMGYTAPDMPRHPNHEGGRLR
jgi:hypothetical protein